ncbi:2-succinyl-5-enolpyruvyl-6-hydroxy-3-cyclohexene-1-carboxylic-acid synthase [Actinomyces massiliensis]|uniref:2-succinyl-5-enolpyruvyl-6-hydroxy-3- cyclohexene-1-carboxylic-acid synthase n=1 Tax=Actinomyces massiliensis TaxID=461393 RepID=UPI0028E29121|nr:2-succinyl-5-enolpyruvyl-6-hydroxy-3-cyclohexene-1-carboxylic-acid synthase [Actinomyces massiliensis]
MSAVNAVSAATQEPRGAAPDGEPAPAALLTAQTVLAALVDAGVRHVVLSLGSRSAPFVPVLADAEAAGLIDVRVVLDERSAGFVALGMARAGMRRRCTAPAAVITTSGTAVASLHPAVLEADAAGIPLLLITADRPHELVGTGANQTTEQTRMFGAAVRTVVDLPADLPRDLGADAAIPAIGGQVRRAVEAARGRLSRDPGPVQINVRFRPPLAGPSPGRLGRSAPRPAPAPPGLSGLPGQSASAGPAAVPAPASGTPAAAPAASPDGAPPQPRRPRSGACGLVVVGDTADDLGHLGRALAEHLNWPLLAEPTSGARGGPQALVRYAELLGASAGAELSGRAERIVVLGHPSLTRSVTALLARRDPPIDVLTSTARWTDVAGTAAAVHAVGASEASEAMESVEATEDAEAAEPEAAGARSWDVPALAAALGLEAAPTSWTDAWREAEHRLPDLPEEGEALTPDGAVLAVYASCQSCHGSGNARNARGAGVPAPALVLGSSMTIRRLDRLAPPATGCAPAPIANRGLAGIDGTLATALGVALAQDRGAGVRVVVGDLTFLHDAMSLGRGRGETEPDLQVVVIDDAGGAIFSTLEYPAVTAPPVFDRYFTAPQGADIAALARALGARVHQPRTMTELCDVLAGPVHGLSVVHVSAQASTAGSA